MKTVSNKTIQTGAKIAPLIWSLEFTNHTLQSDKRLSGPQSQNKGASPNATVSFIIE